MKQEPTPGRNGGTRRKAGAGNGAAATSHPDNLAGDQAVGGTVARTAASSAALTIEHSFRGCGVRTVMKDGEPWFVAADVCSVLEQPNVSQVSARLDDDEKGVANVETLGGAQTMSVVNESGIYNLIFTSRKPQAKAFRRWVTGEVLPAIRRTGRYDAGGKEQGRQPGDVHGIPVVLPRHGRYIIMAPQGGDLHVRRTELEALIPEADALDCRIMACTLQTIAAFWHKVQQLRSLGLDPENGVALEKLEQAILEGADLARFYLSLKHPH